MHTPGAEGTEPGGDGAGGVGQLEPVSATAGRTSALQPTLGESIHYQSCVCVSPRLCYVGGVGLGLRRGVARQSLAALECVRRVPGMLGIGVSRKPTLGPAPPSFPTHVHTHIFQGTLGLQESCAEPPCPHCSSSSSPTPRRGRARLLGGELELSLEPTPAFSVGAWKPLGAWVAPALPLRDKLGIPGRSGPPPPCQAPCQAWQIPEAERI